MRYTHVEVGDWFGLYRGDELVEEGHELEVSELAAIADQDGDFSLESIDGRGTDLETVIRDGGPRPLRGLPLDRVRELAA